MRETGWVRGVHGGASIMKSAAARIILAVGGVLVLLIAATLLFAALNRNYTNTFCRDLERQLAQPFSAVLGQALDKPVELVKRDLAALAADCKVPEGCALWFVAYEEPGSVVVFKGIPDIEPANLDEALGRFKLTPSEGKDLAKKLYGEVSGAQGEALVDTVTKKAGIQYPARDTVQEGLSQSSGSGLLLRSSEYDFWSVHWARRDPAAADPSWRGYGILIVGSKEYRKYE